MPNIGYYHPLIVHFVIGLLFVGVTARILSLLPLGPRSAFLGPMAAALVLLGTMASVAAFRSGHDAHSVSERVPGARIRARTGRMASVFLGVAALEMLLLYRPRRASRWSRIAAEVRGAPSGAHGLARRRPGHAYAGGGRRAQGSCDLKPAGGRSLSTTLAARDSARRGAARRDRGLAPARTALRRSGSGRPRGAPGSAGKRSTSARRCAARCVAASDRAGPSGRRGRTTRCERRSARAEPRQSRTCDV